MRFAKKVDFLGEFRRVKSLDLVTSKTRINKKQSKTFGKKITEYTAKA